ncbi:PAS domain S-box protein [Ammoniphilus sp. CFH 90114]|uniref:PAS domain S-box protein n=1 Tax=Ammoniphilus sp. CFH 90114 TaxID=2493665 RepID=UPI00100F1CBE|nr:PAS domain S-box protein [Ammoniphilus sp. CFH 90114]RXT05650.1 PAS domain S-box protein [Ammoniphilus sp. CFH 90114]
MSNPIVDAFEILERITDAFFALDEQWNFTYINAEATRLLFRSREDLIGKNVWEEFPEATQLPFYEQYHKAVREQIPVTFDSYYSPLKSWYDVRAYPSSNGLSVYFQDITKKKMVSAKSEQHYKSLFEHNPNAVFSFDLEGNYLSVNPAMERLLGYSEEEYLHHSFMPLVSEDDQERTMKHYKMAAEGTTQHYETKALHKDGSIVYVDVTNMPIIVDYEVVGVYGVARDITSTKKAEAALKQKTQQLEFLIDHNVDPILIFSLQGNVIRVNKAFEETFGWSKVEILSLGLYQLPIVPTEYLHEVRECEAEVRRGKQIIGLETRRLRKDGQILNVMLYISPIEDAKGNLNGWSVTLRDITAWKRSQELLQNTEKLSVAGQLAAGIAHEIRNPITAIKGFVQLMRSGYGEKKEYFDIMSSEIERIEHILSELLILAKPQVSRFESKDIRSLIAQVITLLDTQAILKNVEIVTEVHSEFTHLPCDENQLKQVFINFIKNAIEAMPTGGKLLIQIQSTNREILFIRFIDEGIGMPEEVLAKLGQPFFTTKDKGTGLGYMISKKIIENHFGEVHIRSELNKGTTIEISFSLQTKERA